MDPITILSALQGTIDILKAAYGIYKCIEGGSKKIHKVGKETRNGLGFLETYLKLCTICAPPNLESTDLERVKGLLGEIGEAAENAEYILNLWDNIEQKFLKKCFQIGRHPGWLEVSAGVTRRYSI